MKSESTSPNIQSETVENLVNRYLNEWDYTKEQTRKEIETNFVMAESEIQKALAFLDRVESRRKPRTMVVPSAGFDLP